MHRDSAPANACQRLEAALATLDPHSRRLMERFLQGAALAEIAGDLKAPEPAVAEKIRQIVEELRSSMGG
jgi:DNA-directed RNA polymerase specialized sigma24 family protein